MSKVAPSYQATPIGNGWAANTINTAIFRHHGILTQGRFQFCAFYSDNGCLRVMQRDLHSGSVFTADIGGEFNLHDAHNSISLGCDRDGYIHIAYDHHATQLRYRRSTAPLSIHSWTEELTMTNQYEERITYPAFLMMPNEEAMLLLYRDGGHDRGTARLKEYDETNKSWSDLEPGVLSGANQYPWTSNAYWNHPAIGHDGTLHLSFVWRTHLLGTDNRINNINVDYARSPDLGRSWYSSRGHEFRLPITQVNSETVWPVSPGSNLINQSSMALDASDHPHIVFYSNDPDNIPQYQHLWFDGRVWQHNFISQRAEKFVLTGNGTLQIPVSRPEIVIDDDNRVYVIYRGDLTNNRMVAQRLLPPYYKPDASEVRILWDESLGFAEPVIDHFRWQQDRVLSMLIQKNYQPAHDVIIEPKYEPLYLTDIQLVELWAT